MRAVKITGELEHVSCVDRLGKVGLFSMEKRSLQGDLIAAFQHMKVAYKKSGGGGHVVIGQGVKTLN